MNSVRTQITIITPTQNRPYHLTRLLDYYAGTGLKMVIIDSSPQALESPLLKSDLVSYHHQTGLTFVQKWRALAAHVQTPYVVFCSDDDFVTPLAIDTCLEFLNSHPEYTVADGQRMRIINRNGKNTYYPELRTEDYPGKNNNDPDIITRVRHQFTPHEGLPCAVMRTQYLHEAMQYCENQNAKGDLLALVLDTTLACKGKTIILPVFYSALSYIPGSGGTREEYTLEFDEQKMNAVQRAEFYQLIESAAKPLSETAQVSPEEAQSILHTLFAAQHTAHYNTLIRYPDTSVLKRLARVFLPRRLYELVGESVKTVQLLKFLRQHKGNVYGDSVAKQELESIAGFVEKYNSYTSIKVKDSSFYLRLRFALVDRHFAVKPAKI